MPDITVTTLQCAVTADISLEVRRLFADPGGPPVLLVHGLVEDGGVFCPRNGAGLAVFLAEAGFDVFVPDLRGHGASPPKLGPGVSITQHAMVVQDIPALFELIENHHPGEPVFAAGHAWGSVLLAAALIRQPVWLDRIAGLMHFASRRVARNGGWRQRLMLDTLWGKVMPALGRRQGLIPARSLGIGSNDVSLDLHAGQLAWSRAAEWRDLDDGFDYALRLEELSWPPGLYLAGKDDKYLGQFDDVKAFARGFGPHDMQMILLQKGTGCSRDYGHNDLLTHPQATLDHFPLVLAWMQQRLHGAKTAGNAA